MSGAEVRTQNVTAALSVANVVKTSLGPIGLDKMLVDDLGEVTITNDGATILAQLEVEHPAARVLVQLSEMQDVLARLEARLSGSSHMINPPELKIQRWASLMQLIRC